MQRKSAFRLPRFARNRSDFPFRTTGAVPSSRLFFLCSLQFAVLVSLCLGGESPGNVPIVVRCTIPDYAVARQGDIDAVTLPGGRLLAADEGRPIVPYFLKTVTLRAGTRVQSVSLKERSGASNDSGLKLEISQPTEGAGVPVIAGFYPGRDFAWKTVPGPEGTVTLCLSVFPFQYDPESGRVQFFRSYEFEVNSVETGVAIARLEPDKPVYDPGDVVRTRLKLENQAAAQNVVVEARMLAPADTTGTSLPPVRRQLGKADSLVLEWNSAGQPVGEHRVSVVVKDQAGNTLDRRQALFQIGRYEGEVTSLLANPEHFRLGDSIVLVLEFKNTGTCELSGECVFRIAQRGQSLFSEAEKRDSPRQSPIFHTVAEEFTQPLSGLKPGAVQTFRQVWDGKAAVKGAVYSAVGFVRFAGTASAPRRVSFSTNQMPIARFTAVPEIAAVAEEVKFDAKASADPDGSIKSWQWDFGDGASAEGEKVSHAFHVPGSYDVTLKVTDNEGGIGVAAKAMVVK